MTSETPSIVDRAQGYLVGQAIGDALGAPVEGYKHSSIRARYGHVTDFLQDHPLGMDDTEDMALNALIIFERGLEPTEADVRDIWRRWLMAPDSGFSNVVVMHNLRRGTVTNGRDGVYARRTVVSGVAAAMGAQDQDTEGVGQ